MSWLEVETKARVNDLNETRKKVKAIARFLKNTKRQDRYFAIDPDYPKKSFRVRTEGNLCTINFKKWSKDLWDKDIVVKEEFEFNLSKSEVINFLGLFKDLGFREWVDKIKDCEVYSYKKDPELHIELNKVAKLGHFLEIEYLCQKKDLAKAKSRIREVLKSLGINSKDIDNTGYTKMLWEKR